jgi:hypothetical protein
MLIPRIRLLDSLATRPYPGTPQWKMFFPIPYRTGVPLVTSSASPPHMKERVPARAPRTPPDIGVSIKVTPAALAATPNSVEGPGRMVEVSRIMAPFLAEAKTPPSIVIAS